ncbi:MAG: phage tail tape measure protein [Lachnospiraceae bacterium]|nr:phage tail tape measure protein [Lachnospiraceae bacterium]
MAGTKTFQMLFQLVAQLGPGFSQSFKNASQTMKALQGNLRSANQKLKDVSAYQKQQAAVENSKRKVSGLQSEYDKLVEETGDLSEATDEQKEKLQNAATALAKAEDAAASEQAKLEELKNTLREAGVNTDNLGQDTERLRQRYERLEQAQRRVNEINSKQAKNNAAISQAKKQLAGLTGTVTAVGAAIYNGPVKKAADFEQQMSTVKSLVGTVKDKEMAGITKQAGKMGLAYQKGTDATETTMNILAAKAKQMGATTKFTAKEAGEALEYMAVAGWSADEMLSGVSGVMNLAAASGTDLGTTSDIVTDSIENFGLSAKEATHFVDVMAQTARKSNTDVLKLGESYKYVSPVAKAMGYSVEDINVALGLMANSGIKASAGGTALRTLITNMSNPTSNMQQAMHELGVSLNDRKGNMKSFHDVMLDLRKGFGTLKIPVKDFQEQIAKQSTALEKGEISQKVYDKNILRLTKRAYGAEGALKAQSAAMLAGKEGMSGLLAIVNASDETFNSLTKDINKADGAAEEMAKIKLDNYNGQVTLLESAFDAFQTEIGLLVLPALTELVKKITAVTSAAADFVSKNPETVKTIAKIAAGLAGLKAGSLIAKMGFLQISNGILGVKKAFAIISGIGLGGYLENASKGTHMLAAAFSKLRGSGSSIISYFKNIGGAAKGIGTAAKGIILSFGNVLKNTAVFTKISGLFGGIAERMKGRLINAGSQMLTFMFKPFSAMGGMIGSVIGKGFSRITAFIAPVGNAIKAMSGPLGKLATSVLGPLGGIVGKVLPVVGVVTTVITVVQLLKNHFEDIRKFIKKTFGSEALAVFDKVTEVISNIGNTIKNVFSDGNIGAARNKIQEIFGGNGVKVFDTLVNVFGTVKNAISDVIQFVVQNIVPVAEQVLQVLTTSIIPGIVSFVQAAAPIIMSIIQNIVGFIGTAIPVIAGFIAELMPVISGIITFLQTYVLPVIGEIFNFITSTVLPGILAAVETLAPVIINGLQTVLPIVQTVFTTIWGIIQPIMHMILQVVQTVLPSVLSVFKSVFDAIGGVVSGLKTVLSGIIQFITGVFTGNWQSAWDGIKSIFSGIWDSIKSIAKGVIDGISSAVKGVADGISKVKETVGGVGSKIAKTLHIPGFASGTGRTPDTFIAGEDGPELITNAPGMKVYTAAQTRRMLSNAAYTGHTLRSIAQAQEADTVNNVNIGESGIGTSGSCTITINVTNSPVINVTGEATDKIKEQLQRHDRELLEKLRETVASVLREQIEQEARVAYV